jgi:hypothetical protein
MEEIIKDIRGIASILKILGDAENDTAEKRYVLEFLSKKLSECAVVLSDELESLKNIHL